MLRFNLDHLSTRSTWIWATCSLLLFFLIFLLMPAILQHILWHWIDISDSLSGCQVNTQWVQNLINDYEQNRTDS